MDAASQQFVVSGYKRSMDVVNLRARTEQTRTPNFAYFQGPQAQKQVLGVDGDVGYNIAPNGNATRVSNAVAKDRRAEIYHHPIKIVRAALDPDAKLENPRTAGKERVVDVTTSNGLKFTLATDAATNLPTRVVSMTDNTNLGDVAIETSFADYEDVGGLKLPKRLTTNTDKYSDGRDSCHSAGDRWRHRRPDGAPGRRVRAGDRRTAAGHGHRRGTGERHLVPWRPEPSQRAGGVRGSPDADRGAAERHARARGDRQGEVTAPGETADAGDQHAPSLRPLWRHPRRRRRGPDRDHPQGERRVLSGRGRAAPHDSCPTRSRRRQSP